MGPLWLLNNNQKQHSTLSLDQVLEPFGFPPGSATPGIYYVPSLCDGNIQMYQSTKGHLKAELIYSLAALILTLWG